MTARRSPRRPVHQWEEQLAGHSRRAEHGRRWAGCCRGVAGWSSIAWSRGWGSCGASAISYRRRTVGVAGRSCPPHRSARWLAGQLGLVLDCCQRLESGAEYSAARRRPRRGGCAHWRPRRRARFGARSLERRHGRKGRSTHRRSARLGRWRHLVAQVAPVRRDRWPRREHPAEALRGDPSRTRSRCRAMSRASHWRSSAPRQTTSCTSSRRASGPSASFGSSGRWQLGSDELQVAGLLYPHVPPDVGEAAWGVGTSLVQTQGSRASCGWTAAILARRTAPTGGSPGGSSEASTPQLGVLSELDFVDAARGWCLFADQAQEGLYATSDGGTTWHRFG
jgi:hypothetical protein